MTDLLRYLARFALLAICVLIGACTPPSGEEFTTAEERDLAARVIDDIQQNKGDDLAALTAPELREKMGANLPALHALLPDGAEATRRLVQAGSHTLSMGGKTTRRSDLFYEVDQGDRRTLLRVSLVKAVSGGEDNVAVTNISVNTIAAPVEELARFTFQGKGAAQYAVLACAIAAPLLCITALILLYVTPGIRRRWAWTLVIIVCLPQVSVSWNSGAVQFSPASANAFGSGYYQAGPLADPIVVAAFPLGAVVFLIRRRALTRRAVPAA